MADVLQECPLLLLPFLLLQCGAPILEMRCKKEMTF
jgi:hypothetical protein